jgi:hypothetical protein
MYPSSVVVCCCVQERWGGLLEAVLCKIVRSVGGIVVSITVFQAIKPGSIPGCRSFVLHVLKTESDHEFESRSCY